MKKFWIILAVIAAVIVLGALAVHYLPVMWAIAGGVGILVGAVAGWCAKTWWTNLAGK